uniref:nSTAND1 domain-containing NTPase n=1 Tax=Candidatus Thiosymbion oneisti TaxID=589554 RepID=UPI001061F533
MAYTPGFDYDLFISFSHRDNAPRPGQDTGWVERFVDYLEWWLGKRRGLAGLKIWWDQRRLTGATELDRCIEQDLGRTALLVVLHSHNYRNSAYCKQELDWFVAAAKSQPLGLAVNGERRIFNILINKISHEEWTDSGHWTEPLAGTLGFKFHDAPDDQDAFGDPIEDSDPARYDTAMRPIVDAATRLLKSFPAPQDGPEPSPTDQPAGDRLPEILIADVPDSQAKLRKRLIAEIGDRARIAEPIPPPYPAAEHDTAVQRALEQVELSIHLLDGWPGRAIDGGEHSYSRRQAELAQAAPARSLFWLPDSLDLAVLDDADHRDWLRALETDARSGAGYQLQRSSPVRLIEDVLEQLAGLRTDQADTQAKRTIVIDPHPIDQHQGFKLETNLKHRVPALKLAVTHDGAEPADRWTDFEQRVEHARELIVLYGQVDPKWVRSRIERAVRIAAAQPIEDMALDTLWVWRLRDHLGSEIRQLQSSLPPRIQMRVLDNTDVAGIVEALVEHTARPQGEEGREEGQPLASNPFVGLRPFERADSLYYFGRDAQIQALLTSLHQSRFLALVGSSGCGKSSLIRAGLIPALEAGFLVQDRDRWRIATCKPGETPLMHLAVALLATTGGDPDAATRLADQLLEEGVEAALECLGPTLKDDHTNLLLLVDQFEELFRFGQDSIETQGAGTQAATRRAEAEAFVDLLLQLASRDRLPVYCVITMRSDFIGDCDAFTGLPQAINRGQFLVPRLTRVQRREAITGPVHLTGERIAPRLVDRLLNERLDTRDDLPILQHVLMRCWDAWSEHSAASPDGPHDQGPIDLRHYEQIQTIRGALNAHADEALKELRGEDQDLARRLFQALTEVDLGNRRIRRPTRLSQLCAITGATEPQIRHVIDCFRQGGEKSGRNFLVLSGDRDPMIDISHESLIRQWKNLWTWVDQETADTDIYRRLAETAGKHSEAEPRFYRDAALQEAIDWQRRQQPTAAWAERYRPGFQPALAFLQESRLLRIQEHRERRQARIEREQARLERERLLQERAKQEQANAKLAQEKSEQDRRARRTALNWSLGLGVLAVLMLLLAGYTLHLWNDAQEKTQIAETAEQTATLAAEQAESARRDAETQRNAAEFERNRAKDQLLKASINLARVHEEKALFWLERASNTEHTGDYQRVLLRALQAQRQPIQGKPGLQPKGMDRLTDPRIAGAFRERWQSPTPQLNSTPNDIAWSPDGKQMATGQSDGSIRIWDAATGRPLHKLTGHDKSVTSVAFSPDGKRLASASTDNTVRLWDPVTGEPIRTLTGHEDMVWSVAFSPDGKRLASGSDDGTLRLWDAASGEPIRILTGHENVVRSVDFSPDGKRLASGSSDRTLRLWDATSGELIRTLTGHGSMVTAVAFSPDGKWLASGSADGTLRLRDPASGEPIRILTGHKGRVTAVAFSPDGQRLASASWDSTVRLWDAASGEPIRILTGHEEGVNDLAFSPDGQRLASVSWDNTVRLWDAATGEPIRILTGHEADVNDLAFSPDGKWLASGSEDKTIRLWDPATGESIRILTGHEGRVTAVAFSPDGKRLASGSNDGTLRLWDAASGALIRILTGHERSVTTVAFSPDGKLLASASSDRTLRLWNLATGELIRTLTGHEGDVNSVAFSRDGSRLASGSYDETLRLWDAASGELIRTLTGHEGSVTAVAFSGDGSRLASASYDGTLRLWDAASGQPIRTLTGYKSVVTAVAFSPDGNRLASGSWDNTLRLWDAASGEPIRIFTGHESSVTAVAFSPDGKRLASASDDG